MAFADDVVERRKEFVKLEDRAAKAMHDELQRMLDEARAKLATMADFTDATGKFIDNAPARKRMDAVIADIQSALNDSLLQATHDLVDARETAFKMGAATAQFATEKATGNDFEASTAQLFRQAAKEAATRKVLLDPTQSKTFEIVPGQAFDGVQKATSADIQELLSKAVLRGADIRQTSKKLQEVGDVTKRAATRIVRTNINAAQNDAHMAFFRAHPDVFSGVRWEAVMDARTSTICAALNGRFFTLDEDPPGPPAHPNCRCTLVGVLKDDELEQETQNTKKSVKNTVTGEYEEVFRDKKFEDWLREQPASKSTKITGSKLKDQLFRDNKLDLKDLIKPNLKTRTDKEAVELAVAIRPHDAELQALKARIGGLQRSLQEIDVSDALLAAQNKFNKGSGGEDDARANRLKAAEDAKKTDQELRLQKERDMEPTEPRLKLENNQESFSRKVSGLDFQKLKAGADGTIKIEDLNGKNAKYSNEVFTSTVDGEQYIVKLTPTELSARREEVSKKVADLLGIGNWVPPATVLKAKIEKFGASYTNQYAVMKFIPKIVPAAEKESTNFLKTKVSDEDKGKIILFDLVIGNTDRHGFNYGIANGKIVLFDHGRTFMNNDVYERKHLFTDIIPGRAEDEKSEFRLPKDFIAKILENKAAILEEIKALKLSSDHIEATLERFKLLKRLMEINEPTIGDILP